MIKRLFYRLLSLFRPSRQTARIVLFCGEDVLLVRHRLGGKYWSIPGGGLERNETPQEAVQREVEEELGIKNIDATIAGNLNHLSRGQKIYSTIFRATIPNKVLKIDRIEIKDWGWFKLDKLPELNGPAKEAIFMQKKHNA